MKPGSKYYRLFEYLQHCPQEVVTLTFAEIESLMGYSLPPSARTKQSWWGNRDSALHAGAWITAGYQASSVDLEQQSVTFQTFQAAYNVQSKDGEIDWKGNAVKALRLYKGLSQEQFANELGVRRETVSEWENSRYEPDRSKRKLLSLIAKQVNFGVLKSNA
ncbi:transcriptional regulator [filamentous cyanobacterium CCT1]|nr:transcriptional regulator [filamentous cyanobacterium CCT1]PSN77644.1 transcriptional regulator [filamentous cyanobacterium CCP4]